MPTPRAVWGTFQALRKVLALLQDFHYFRTDMQRRRMVKWQNCWPNSTRPPQVPSLLVDLRKFLLPTLSLIPLFVHPSCWDWKMFSCDCVHVFVLESPSVQSPSMFLGEYFCSLGKRKWKILFSIAFCQMLVSEKKRIKCFLMAKKLENADLGCFVRVASHWNFLGKILAEISETSKFFFLKISLNLKIKLFCE